MCGVGLLFSLEYITADVSGLNILSDFLEGVCLINSEMNRKACFLQEHSVLVSSISESVSIFESLLLSDTLEAVSVGLAGAESKSSDFEI
jgi:hypothetical protein